MPALLSLTFWTILQELQSELWLPVHQLWINNTIRNFLLYINSQHAYSGCHTYYEVRMKSRVQNWCQQGPWNVWIFANHSFNVITRLQKRIVINRTRTALLQSLFITWSRDVVSFIYGNTGCVVSSLEIQNPIRWLQSILWYLLNWN